jgi:hypothetical protein
MISEGELLSEYRGTLVYLDANVLVPSITRTLILLCAQDLDYTPVWSPYAETETDRHQRPGARIISELRRQFDIPIVLDEESSVDLVDTDDKDSPILSSAAACGAELLITENVKDFGVVDLGEPPDVRRPSRSVPHRASAGGGVCACAPADGGGPPTVPEHR